MPQTLKNVVQIETKIKQVLVIRKDLGMRKGKMIAQGAHAAIGAMNMAEWMYDDELVGKWFADGATKICVSVDSEKELLDIQQEAELAGLPTYLVKDLGRTEFKEPTFTAVGIGPASAERIDKVTGKLVLL